MVDAELLQLESDFDYLLSFLPEGWEKQAKELGALRRCRKIPDPRMLLRILLIHLAEGCSLRETAVRVRQGGLAEISDVTIMDRLRQAGEWFRWLNIQLMNRWVVRQPPQIFGEGWNVRLVDATQVNEPGPTGSSWRLHYALDLPSLRCSQIDLTEAKGAGNGESFRRFAIQHGDLLVGDRAYGTASGIAHVVAGGGAVLVRFGWQNLPLWSSPTQRFDLLAHLRRLRATAPGDWPVWVRDGEQLIPGRVCAVKRSRPAAEAARCKVKRAAQKQGAQALDETLEAAGYVFVFTTLPAAALPAGKALEFYRGRWQIELVFKRLKSIMGLGHLRKNDPQAARSWIQGKLLVAFLMEALLHQGESFFPWGYPLQSAAGA
jgi:Transposase DDE domain